jgi:5-methylthioadenosine/S-adenosylhomocysteine deaminase
MREAGIRVGLGTDSVASNNRLDLLEEARVAQLVQRARLHSAALLPGEALLRLATIDGARALGLDDRVGTLETGKEADLCAVSFAGAHATPVHDPLAALFHAARAGDVILTAVAGEVLYRDGRHLRAGEGDGAGRAAGLDVGALRPRVQRVAEALRRAREAGRGTGGGGTR